MSGCPSCGAALTGQYCAACGERTARRTDLSITAFLADAIADVLNADSRIWRSLRALVLQPGRLSGEYLAGRRRPWLGPVQLFLLCNVVFFVLLEFLPLYVFTTRLSDHLFAHPYGDRILRMDARPGVTFQALAQDGEAYRAYATTFNTVTAGLAKSLIFLMIPGVAVVLHLLHVARRRYFVEHLLLATHFLAFVLLAIVAAMFTATALERGMRLFGQSIPWEGDALFILVLLALLTPWLTAAFRRFYGQGWTLAVLKVLLFVVAFYVVLVGYRLTLFLLTVRVI
jgi:hypothetical protein